MSPLQGWLGGWHLEAVFCLQGTVHRASLSGLTTSRTQESDLAFLWPEDVCLCIQCLLASKPLWLLRAFRSGMICRQLPLQASPLLCAQQVIQHFFPRTLSSQASVLMVTSMGFLGSLSDISSAWSGLSLSFLPIWIPWIIPGPRHASLSQTVFSGPVTWRAAISSVSSV